jgi:hypothetical protein
MKSLFFALTLLIGAASYASPKLCQLRVNGQALQFAIGEDQNGQGFYSYAANASRSVGCVHAKVYEGQESGRVYSRGQLVPADNGQKKGLSNREAEEAKQRAGGYCQTYSCVNLETHAPQPTYPTQPVYPPQTYPEPYPSDSSY